MLSWFILFENFVDTIIKKNARAKNPRKNVKKQQIIDFCRIINFVWLYKILYVEQKFEDFTKC